MRFKGRPDNIPASPANMAGKWSGIWIRYKIDLMNELSQKDRGMHPMATRPLFFCGLIRIGPRFVYFDNRHKTQLP